MKNICRSLLLTLVFASGLDGYAVLRVAADELPSLGGVKWELSETADGRVVSNGEKMLHSSDITCRSEAHKYTKNIKLSDTTSLTLVANPDAAGSGGFSLSGNLDDKETFSWNWFAVDHPGHAKKLQGGGDMAYQAIKSPIGTEINAIRFLSDVSIGVFRKDKKDFPNNPTWRMKIFKGSVIGFPQCDGGGTQPGDGRP